MFYTGWGLTDQAKEMVLDRLPATFPVVRCDHVTQDLCRVEQEPPLPASIRAYGVLEWEGFQILAVTVDGALYQPRKDRMYHVTISREDGLPSSHAGLILKERQCVIRPVQSFMLPTVPFIRAFGGL